LDCEFRTGRQPAESFAGPSILIRYALESTASIVLKAPKAIAQARAS